MSDETSPDQIGARVSTAVPRRVMIWTNGGFVVAVSINGVVTGDPKNGTFVHVSSVDFPGGNDELARRAEELSAHVVR